MKKKNHYVLFSTPSGREIFFNDIDNKIINAQINKFFDNILYLKITRSLFHKLQTDSSL